jgi:hypothetical protein
MSEPIAASTVAAQAFRMMELAPISSFQDDSPQARAAAEQYPHALDMCLAGYDWSFARHLSRLGLVAELPDTWVEDPELPYLCRLPADCVQLRLVLDEGYAWRRDGEYLRTSSSTGMSIRYTRRITNEKILPSAFQTYLAGQLAALLAPIYVRTAEKISAIERRVATLQQLAIDNDSYSASGHRIDDYPASVDWVSEAML